MKWLKVYYGNKSEVYYLSSSKIYSFWKIHTHTHTHTHIYIYIEYEYTVFLWGNYDLHGKIRKKNYVQA